MVISKKERERIEQVVMAGVGKMGISEMAMAAGVTYSTIQKYARRLGIDVPREYRKTIEDIIIAKHRKMTAKQCAAYISMKMGHEVKLATVRNLAWKHSLSFKPDGQKAVRSKFVKMQGKHFNVNFYQDWIAGIRI